MVFTEKKERAICKTEHSSFRENTTFYTRKKKNQTQNPNKKPNQNKSQPTKPNQKPQTKKLEKR